MSRVFVQSEKGPMKSDTKCSYSYSHLPTGDKVGRVMVLATAWIAKSEESVRVSVKIHVQGDFIYQGFYYLVLYKFS